MKIATKSIVTGEETRVEDFWSWIRSEIGDSCGTPYIEAKVNTLIDFCCNMVYLLLEKKILTPEEVVNMCKTDRKEYKILLDDKIEVGYYESKALGIVWS